MKKNAGKCDLLHNLQILRFNWPLIMMTIYLTKLLKVDFPVVVLVVEEDRLVNDLEENFFEKSKIGFKSNINKANLKK